MAVCSISLESKEVAQGRQLNPITVTWARQNCSGIEIHCLRCSHVGEVDWNRFNENDVLIDLPRRYRFVCSNCRSWDRERIQARPVYPYRSDTRNYLGLEKSKNDSSKDSGD